MVPHIRQNLNSIAKLCETHHVKRLELVGSAARESDYAAGTSDADFLVDFEPCQRIATIQAFFDFKSGLAQILGGEIDLIEISAVRNPFILQQFAKERQLVFAA